MISRKGKLQVNMQNWIWSELNPPVYRKGSDDNNLSIIMQNPHSGIGAFADCNSGGEKVVKLWHPSGTRSRNIRAFKNYLNSRNVFPSLSNFQVFRDIAVRNDLLAQLYADYIYLRWFGKHGYSFIFEKFLDRLYRKDDQ